MAVVNDDLILKLENFRTKVLAILKKKGIILSDDTPLNDDLVNAIDKISTTEGIVDYINDDLEEFISDEITYIHSYGFAGNTKLKKVKFDNLIITGSYVFYNCTNLSNIRLDKLTTISNYFLSNSALKNIVLPNLKNVNATDYNFGGISKLEHLIVPNLVNTLTNSTSIYAFIIDCAGPLCSSNTKFNNLKTLILRYSANNISLYNSTIFPNLEEIYVPNDLLEKYKAATNWSVHASKFKSLEGSKYESLTWYEDEDWYKEEMSVWQ